MATDFNQELLQSYLSKIVETRKEQNMLAGIEQGMVGRVADMMDMKIRRNRGQALAANTSQGVVKYWLVDCGAKPDGYDHCDIEVEFHFVCAPADIVGKKRLTKKEMEVVAELQKIWDDNVKRRYFYDRERYKELAGKLQSLSHRLRCYRVFEYRYNIHDFHNNQHLLEMSYHFESLSDIPYEDISSYDLVILQDVL